MPALPAGYFPSIEATQNMVVRYKKRQYGDGYMQILPDGINPTRYEWNLEFLALDMTPANTLMSFFASLGTLTPSFVQWTAPDGLYGDWIVEDVQRSFISPTISNISCKFIWFQSV